MITDSQVLESYRHHLTVSPRRYAPGTIRSYVNMADRYMHAVPDWATCGVLTVEQFIYGLDRTDSSKRDANAAVRRFYRWAVREGLAAADPTATVELPRMKTPEHSWRQYDPDTFACSRCGLEPWHRATPCVTDQEPRRVDNRTADPELKPHSSLWW